MPDKSIADAIAEGETLWVSCCHPQCSHSVELDLPTLAERLGPDHGVMHADLAHLFKCQRCVAEGRPRRKVMFTLIADYSKNGRWGLETARA